MQDDVPLWVAARSPITFDYAVANNANIMSWPLTMPFAEAENYRALLDDAIAKAETPYTGTFALMRHSAVYENEADRQLALGALLAPGSTPPKLILLDKNMLQKDNMKIFKSLRGSPPHFSPSALAPKAWHRPRGERRPAICAAAVARAPKVLTPSTSARSSPRAAWSATRNEEQAVSSVRAMPRRSRQ